MAVLGSRTIQLRLGTREFEDFYGNCPIRIVASAGTAQKEEGKWELISQIIPAAMEKVRCRH